MWTSQVQKSLRQSEYSAAQVNLSIALDDFAGFKSILIRQPDETRHSALAARLESESLMKLLDWACYFNEMFDVSRHTPVDHDIHDRVDKCEMQST